MHVALTPTCFFSPVSAVTLPLLFLHEHCDEPLIAEGVPHSLLTSTVSKEFS